MERHLKGILAEVVIHHVADLLDDWGTVVEREARLADVDADEAADAIAQWMRYLPGQGWDDRFPTAEVHRP